MAHGWRGSVGSTGSVRLSERHVVRGGPARGRQGDDGLVGPRPGDRPHAADGRAPDALLFAAVAAGGGQKGGAFIGAEDGRDADDGQLLGGDDVASERRAPQNGISSALPAGCRARSAGGMRSHTRCVARMTPPPAPAISGCRWRGVDCTRTPRLVAVMDTLVPESTSLCPTMLSLSDAASEVARTNTPLRPLSFA